MIVGGGTGGHVYPALAAGEAALANYPDAQLVFVGTAGGMEGRLVVRSGLPLLAYRTVQAGPLHGVNPLRRVMSLFRLGIGTLQAFWHVLHDRPGAVLATGGWACFPISVAAWILRVPVLIYLPDIEPGLTINVLKRFARRVAVTVPEAQAFFEQGQTVVTGYPLRARLKAAACEDGVSAFNLDSERKTLLVFGGSQGSRAVNIALGNVLGVLLDDGIQVIHLTGKRDWERSQEQVGELRDHPHYHAYAYLDDIGSAFAAADLIIARAGASVLGEFPYFHLPSILIPLAYSWRYQQVNADYLQKHGAAVHLPETELDTRLLETIRAVLNDDARLATMRDAAAALARGDGADNLARELAALAQGET